MSHLLNIDLNIEETELKKLSEFTSIISDILTNVIDNIEVTKNDDIEFTKNGE